MQRLNQIVNLQIIPTSNISDLANSIANNNDVRIEFYEYGILSVDDLNAIKLLFANNKVTLINFIACQSNLISQIIEALPSFISLAEINTIAKALPALEGQTVDERNRQINVKIQSMLIERLEKPAPVFMVNGVVTKYVLTDAYEAWCNGIGIPSIFLIAATYLSKRITPKLKKAFAENNQDMQIGLIRENLHWLNEIEKRHIEHDIKFDTIKYFYVQSFVNIIEIKSLFGNNNRLVATIHERYNRLLQHPFGKEDTCHHFIKIYERLITNLHRWGMLESSQWCYNKLSSILSLSLSMMFEKNDINLDHLHEMIILDTELATMLNLSPQPAFTLMKTALEADDKNAAIDNLIRNLEFIDAKNQHLLKKFALSWINTLMDPPKLTTAHHRALQSESAPVDFIPTDIWRNIMSFMPTSTTGKMALANKQLQHQVKSNTKYWATENNKTPNENEAADRQFEIYQSSQSQVPEKSERMFWYWHGQLYFHVKNKDVGQAEKILHHLPASLFHTLIVDACFIGQNSLVDLACKQNDQAMLDMFYTYSLVEKLAITDRVEFSIMTRQMSEIREYIIDNRLRTNTVGMTPADLLIRFLKNDQLIELYFRRNPQMVTPTSALDDKLIKIIERGLISTFNYHISLITPSPRNNRYMFRALLAAIHHQKWAMALQISAFSFDWQNITDGQSVEYTSLVPDGYINEYVNLNDFLCSSILSSLIKANNHEILHALIKQKMPINMVRMVKWHTKNSNFCELLFADIVKSYQTDQTIPLQEVYEAGCLALESANANALEWLCKLDCFSGDKVVPFLIVVSIFNLDLSKDDGNLVNIFKTLARYYPDLFNLGLPYPFLNEFVNRNGNAALLNTLIKAGLDINKLHDDENPLLIAVYKSNASLINVLLQGGADTKVSYGPDKKSILHVAIQSMNHIDTAILDLLINHKPSLLQAKDRKGWTALMWLQYKLERSYGDQYEQTYIDLIKYLKSKMDIYSVEDSNPKKRGHDEIEPQNDDNTAEPSKRRPGAGVSLFQAPAEPTVDDLPLFKTLILRKKN